MPACSGKAWVGRMSCAGEYFIPADCVRKLQTVSDSPGNGTGKKHGIASLVGGPASESLEIITTVPCDPADLMVRCRLNV